MRPKKPRLRRALLVAFRRIIRLYFRSVEVVSPPPATLRGRLVAANHVNGIVDPIVVLTSTDAVLAPVAKSTLWRIAPMKFLLDAADAVPVTRAKDDPNRKKGSNDEAFRAIAEHFADGGNLLIFPEGTSHNEPYVIPFKAGAGRMLATAKQKGAVGLTFQACALAFDARDRFRSRTLCVFGPVREVDAIAATGDELANAIVKTLFDDLSELVVEGATWEERVLITRVAELLAADQGDASLAGWSSLGRRVEAARKALGDAQRALYEEVRAAVDDYHRLLEAAGKDDRAVLADRDGAPPRLPLLLTLVLTAPLALVASVFYFVPYRVPRIAGLLAHGETDVVSTYKLGLGLLVFPVWAIGFTVAAALCLPLPSALGAIAAIWVSPFGALPWLDWLEQPRRARGAAPSTETLLAARGRALAAIERARAVVEGAQNE